jgi:hypothetical protein
VALGLEVLVARGAADVLLALPPSSSALFLNLSMPLM